MTCGLGCSPQPSSSGSENAKQLVAVCVHVAEIKQRGKKYNKNSPAWQVAGLDKVETGLWPAV